MLEEAERERTPLCERLTFASIYQSNLDEFFMVRVGSLADQMLVSRTKRDNKTNMTAAEQIQSVLHEAARLNRRKDAVYAALMEQLTDYGVRLVDFDKLSGQEGRELEAYFDREIAPLLSPLLVGRRQPFPFLQDKEIYAVGVLAGKNGHEKLCIIPCGTGVIPRLIAVPGQSGAYMLSEELILHFLSKVFDRRAVVAKSLVRLTRNADIDADALYDEDGDYREFMTELIKRRRRLAPVRLELSRELDGDLIKLLCTYTDVAPESVFRCRSPLDLSFLFQIQDMLRQKTSLFFEKRLPQRSPDFRPGRSILAQIREKDKLLSYPYESMKPFLDFLEEAANDPAVVSIKMTLYRVADHSKIVESLIEAAENGKNVLVLVELKARFDEAHNIEWSRRLEDAGCQVIYGLEGYKVHSKLCLVTRREKGRTEYYTQIGTGNYNEKTSRLYTDLSLMTANTGHRSGSRRGISGAVQGRNRRCGAAASGRAQMPAKSGCWITIEQEIGICPPGRGGLHRREDQFPDRQGHHRQADRRLESRRKNRPHCPRHLLPAARRAGRNREHPCNQHRRAVSGALPRLHFRHGPAPKSLHFLCGFHDPQHTAARGSCSTRSGRRAALPPDGNVPDHAAGQPAGA